MGIYMEVLILRRCYTLVHGFCLLFLIGCIGLVSRAYLSAVIHGQVITDCARKSWWVTGDPHIHVHVVTCVYVCKVQSTMIIPIQWVVNLHRLLLGCGFHHIQVLGDHQCSSSPRRALVPRRVQVWERDHAECMLTRLTTDRTVHV